MTSAIIFASAKFTVTSYGFGLAYVIAHADAPSGVYLQGDDAAHFNHQWELFDRMRPHDDTDLFLADYLATEL